MLFTLWASSVNMSFNVRHLVKIAT